MAPNGARSDVGSRPVALVTGGTSGIGLALVRRLADRYRLVVVGRRPTAEIDGPLPPGAITIQADMAEPADAAGQVMEGLAEQGIAALDLALLAAGTGWYGNPAAEGADKLRRTIAVNLAAPLALAHALAVPLEAASGRLVLVGSVAHTGAANFATYAAAKAGLHGLARALREEWRGRIAVTIVHPGPTRTRMHTEAGYDPGRLATLFASPERMAAMIEAASGSTRPSTSLGLARILGDKLLHRQSR